MIDIIVFASILAYNSPRLSNIAFRVIINSLQEFCKSFLPGQPIMAIDYGGKKLGTALSTPDHLICLPYKLLTKADDQIPRLLHLLNQTKACAIVIGLPVNMDGSNSAQTEIVLNFANKLSRLTDLSIFMQDERLTSRLASNLLKTFGLNRRQRDQRDDLAAASLILETTLSAAKKLIV